MITAELGAFVIAIVVGIWLGRAWSVPFLILAAFFLFFFRDPDRTTPNTANLGLETVGVKSLDDLFEAVPEKHRFPNLNLPPALTEMEAMQELSSLAQANENVRGDLISFLGAGMYNHYIPSVVDHILRRGEFYTAYTPYQP